MLRAVGEAAPPRRRLEAWIVSTTIKSHRRAEVRFVKLDSTGCSDRFLSNSHEANVLEAERILKQEDSNFVPITDHWNIPNLDAVADSTGITTDFEQNVVVRFKGRKRSCININWHSTLNLIAVADAVIERI